QAGKDSGCPPFGVDGFSPTARTVRDARELRRPAYERRSRAAVSALQALAPFSYSTLDFRYYSHLITRPALTSTFGGIVRPICLAALRLIISSNLVGCSTGRSAGLAPFKILSA